MRKFLAMAATGGVLAAGAALTTLPAQAASGVTATYGCNSATFHNNTSKTAGINYGTAGSDDIRNIAVPAGRSVTVTMKHTNFGWTATHADGTEVGGIDYPGVDLTKKCSSKPSATKPATKAPTKQSDGGLAKTGF